MSSALSSCFAAQCFHLSFARSWASRPRWSCPSSCSTRSRHAWLLFRATDIPALLASQPGQLCVYPYVSSIHPWMYIDLGLDAVLAALLSSASSSLLLSKVTVMGIANPGLLGFGLPGIPFMFLINAISRLSSSALAPATPALSRPASSDSSVPLDAPSGAVTPAHLAANRPPRWGC